MAEQVAHTSHFYKQLAQAPSALPPQHNSVTHLPRVACDAWLLPDVCIRLLQQRCRVPARLQQLNPVTPCTRQIRALT